MSFFDFFRKGSKPSDTPAPSAPPKPEHRSCVQDGNKTAPDGPDLPIPDAITEIAKPQRWQISKNTVRSTNAGLRIPCLIHPPTRCGCNGLR